MREACLTLVSDKLPEFFELIQLAFSRGGSERAVHRIQAQFEMGGPSSMTIKTDLRNAFNEIHRARFYAEAF